MFLYFTDMHTSGGNSNGAPCEFPFLYNGTWHHSCLAGVGEQTLEWCSTTANYDVDEKWGNCLKYGKVYVWGFPMEQLGRAKYIQTFKHLTHFTKHPDAL